MTKRDIPKRVRSSAILGGRLGASPVLTQGLIASGLLWAGLVGVALITLLHPTDSTVSQLLCYCFTCLAGLLVYLAVFDNQMRASGLDLRNPIALYGLFYALYYAVPLAIFAKDPWSSKHNLLFMIVVITLGFIGFYAGVRISRCSPRGEVAPFRGISGSNGRAVLMLCYLLCIFVALHFGYRISIGQFFTHASSYTVDATVYASFFEVFCGALPFPLILLLGLATATVDKQLARHAEKLLDVYIVLLYGTFIASSQFRPSLTALVLYAVARSLAGKKALHLKHALVLLCIAVFALTVIQEVRANVDQAKISSVPEQLKYTFEETYGAAVRVLSGNSLNEGNNTRTQDRAMSALKLLSDSRDALHLRNEYLHGATFRASAISQVPRFLWPDKPERLSTQRYIEQLLHLPDEDSSPSPITQFYVEWGVPAVLIGFLIFGLIMGGLTRLAFRKGAVPMLIVAFCTWSACVQVETELFASVMGGWRIAAVLTMLYYAARLLNAVLPTTSYERANIRKFSLSDKEA